MDIHSYIDHTLLRAAASKGDIAHLCQEAIENRFYAVCVNGCFVSYCAAALKEANTHIASVVGFPLGSNHLSAKQHEAMVALEDGAHEIDMVINMSWIKSKEWSKAQAEIEAIKKQMPHQTLKVILEMCYLTENEKQGAIQLALDAGADYLKTSTGFGNGGATPQDVALMIKMADGKAKVKASGSIKDFETAKKYIELGVSRIGTSRGTTIMQQLPKH